MDSDFPEWWRSLRRPRTHIPFCDKLREFTPIPEEYSCVLVRLLPYGLFRDKLRELTWREFEKLVFDLFEQLGADPKISPVGRPNGAKDILLRFTGGDFIIQCKKWKAKVGAPRVWEVYGVAAAENKKGAIIVTTSDFSGPAKCFAIDLSPPVILINGEDLFHLMNQHMRSVLEEVLKGIWKSEREARIKHEATPLEAQEQNK